MDKRDDFRWSNRPERFSFGENTLHVRTADKTDFWRGTFYGFWRDNGHFFYRPVEGDFTVEVTVDGRYEELYDQAGLMLRLSESHWIKAGVEFVDGIANFSTVVTNDNSDWSVQTVSLPPSGLRVRATRHAESIRVQYLDGNDGLWKIARLAYLPASRFIDVGMMCCSPQRSGFEVTFRDFQIGPPIARKLHE